MVAPTVFIVDDDLSAVDALREMLLIVGLSTEEFSSPQAFLEFYDGQMPGCLLLGSERPSTSVYEVLERLRVEHRQIPVIILAGEGDVAGGVQAMRAGAFHFLEKPCPADHLTDVILSAIDADQRRRSAGAQLEQFLSQLKSLTDEERSVLKGIVLDKTMNQIASELDISPRTVQFRRSSLMAKLRVSTKTELMTLVFQTGWRPTDDR